MQLIFQFMARKIFPNIYLWCFDTTGWAAAIPLSFCLWI